LHLLEASGISFSYSRLRKRDVLSAFDWRIEPGQTTLLLGPNGAGKSTLLRLLSGYHRPQRGQVRYDGESSRAALFANVGWMPQVIHPAHGLTALEQLEYAAWIGGANRRSALAVARESLALVKLSDKASVRSAQLSGGQLRRLGLAQALVRRAPVLLLDEPTAGLDPAQAITFRSLLKDLDCPGGIVVSTHQVSDVADQVDRVVVLAEGRIAFDGTTNDFRTLGTSFGVSSGSLAEIFAHLVSGGLH
jgi:ABC-2 type transport system ATP-binding protein